jgi:DnaK suppressor protein
VTIDTEHFRKELLEHRTRLLGTIKHHDIGNSSLTEETGELMSSSVDNHLADTASETYERELDEGLEDDARDQLRQVDEALARIEAGVYGTCSLCGKAIPVERLEALPWTTLCIEDARRQQR